MMLPNYFTTAKEFKIAIHALLEEIPSEKADMHQAAQSLLVIFERLDHQQKQVMAQEMTGIADSALQLLAQINVLQPQNAHKISHLSFSLAVWFAQRSAVLSNLELTVNGLANAANSTQQKIELEALFEACTYLFSAIDETIKQDIDRSNPGRPWRVFLLNYGIISTRTHNLDIMDSAFKTLVQFLPEEVPDFFRQGMAEMVRLDYPSHVRVVMQRYAEKYSG